MNHDEDALSPAEAEAARLLSGLRGMEAQHGAGLAASVTRTVRWQRTARHSLVSMGTVLGSVAGGVGHLLRRRP